MNTQYYRLNLENYACPSFSSHSKAYYGTLSQVQAFIDALAASEKSRENYGYLIEAFREYKTGNTEVCHRVLYHEERLLTPVELITTKTVALDNYTWEHLNIWQCPYMMSCDHAETIHLWLKDGEKYVRCVAARFEGLKYDGKPLDGWFWGFPRMIAEDGRTTFNRLAVIEKRFETQQECQENCAAFNEKDIDLTEVCNDIFGDG